MTISANLDRASSLPPPQPVKIRRCIASPYCHTTRKTKRAPKTSATQRPQRPLLAKNSSR